MIELHQQTSDILYRGVLQSSVSERKMKNMVMKIVNQLTQERVANKVNRIHINDLERKIISLGEYPKNTTVVGYLIKEKDNKIKILNKNINFPDVKHVHNPDMQATREEKKQIY